MRTDRAGLLSTAVTGVVVPIAVLTAVMIGLGFLLTHVLVHVWPFTAEDQAVRALTATRTPTLDNASNMVSLVAYTIGLVTALVVAGCIMRIVLGRWREFFFLALALLSQAGVYMLTARVVARARPPVPKLDVFPEMQSFPSGHVAAAVAIYGGIAVVLTMHARRKAHAAAWWVVLLIIPVAVGVSRVYRGMHYPSDVAASFVVGLGCLWILHRALLTPAEPAGLREP